MIVDLRSDTVTLPSLAMKAAMFETKVGDDILGEDPTVHALETQIASIFGKEAALYCPSGTMTNQVAIRTLTQPQDEVICDKNSHIHLYEAGGPAYNSLVSLKLLNGDRGRLSAPQISEAINPDFTHFTNTSLISLENTMNKGGGACYALSELKKIKRVADANNLKMHLDGARVFNALVESGDDPKKHGRLFDTISVCFSKGLGAPVGSAILGSEADIKRAKKIRQVFGGAMRQSGYLAAACIYALDNNIDRLKEDHERARALSEIVMRKPFVEEVMPVETNIVIFRLGEKVKILNVLDKLAARGILAVAFGKREIRLVTHLDFTDDMLTFFEKAFSQIDF